MPPTPPTDAELNTMIPARLASVGIDLDQLPTTSDPATGTPTLNRSCRRYAGSCDDRSRAGRLPAARPQGPIRPRPPSCPSRDLAAALPLDPLRVDEAVSAPIDTLLARRTFLARMSAAVAVATAGGAVLRLPVLAAPPPPGTLPETLTSPDAYAQPRPEALADLTELTIAEAATLIREGRLDPRVLVEAYLARIAAYDATYQAFNLVLADEAIGPPGRSRGPYRGALHGIPLAIKDNYYTAGVRPRRTRSCSRTSCRRSTRPR